MILREPQDGWFWGAGLCDAQFRANDGEFDTRAFVVARAFCKGWATGESDPNPNDAHAVLLRGIVKTQARKLRAVDETIVELRCLGGLCNMQQWAENWSPVPPELRQILECPDPLGS